MEKLYVKLQSCKLQVSFILVKLIKLSQHMQQCWLVVRVLLYARSDKVVHEGPSALNYLHHARKTLFHWKLTHNNFTQENSVAVNVQLCCLMNPSLFRLQGLCKVMHLVLWSWPQLQALHNLNQLV